MTTKPMRRRKPG